MCAWVFSISSPHCTWICHRQSLACLRSHLVLTLVIIKACACLMHDGCISLITAALQHSKILFETHYSAILSQNFIVETLYCRRTGYSLAPSRNDGSVDILVRLSWVLWCCFVQNWEHGGDSFDLLQILFQHMARTKPLLFSDLVGGADEAMDLWDCFEHL